MIYGPGDVIEFDGRDYSLFLDGDDLVGAAPNIVEVDPVARTAGLYLGLDESALFVGANQDMDAPHFDDATGSFGMVFTTADVLAIRDGS